MKTIVTTGCSWTWGHGIEANETYAAHLQNTMKGWQVINAGHCGADIDHAIFSAVSVIEAMPVDFVIFQLSTMDRITMGSDGFENFLDGRFFNKKDESIYYEFEDSQYKRLIGIADNIKTKFTDGSYTAEDKFRKKEFEYSGIRNTKYKEYKDFVKLLTENFSYSTYKFQKTCVSLLTFENYLKQKNIKSLYFSYFPNKNDVYFSKYFKMFLNDSNYIEQCWKSWLHEKYPDHEYYIDFSHLNSEGNCVLANEYLMPHIERLL